MKSAENQKALPSTEERSEGKEIICGCKGDRSSRESEPDIERDDGQRRDEP